MSHCYLNGTGWSFYSYVSFWKSSQQLHECFLVIVWETGFGGKSCTTIWLMPLLTYFLNLCIELVVKCFSSVLWLLYISVCIYICVCVCVWHHQLNRHKFEQGPGVGNRQGSLACCSPESDTTEQLNWTQLYIKEEIALFLDKESRKTHTNTQKNPRKAMFYIYVILETFIICYFSAKCRFFSSKSSD